MLKLHKSLMVNTDEILQVHPQIEVKVHHIINVWENKNGKIESTVEMSDYTLHSFMGEAVGSIPAALVNELENDFQMMQENNAVDARMHLDHDEFMREANAK